MKVLRVISAFIFLISFLFVFAGCENNDLHVYEAIPAGYIGKVLTPLGWEKDIITSGQVDLYTKDIDYRTANINLPKLHKYIKIKSADLK